MVFPDKNEKRIPKSLQECVKPDGTVTELSRWAGIVETRGQILLALVILAGVFLTIAEVVVLLDTEEGAMLLTVISSVVGWSLGAVVTYCTYHVIALLLRAAALITQHTMISANVALFEQQKMNGEAGENRSKPQKPHEKWECPACSHMLPFDVIQCSNCGYKR